MQRFVFTHPEEDRQVCRNIGGLENVPSSFVFIILIYEENIYTHWMLVRVYIYTHTNTHIYIYIYINVDVESTLA